MLVKRTYDRPRILKLRARRLQRCDATRDITGDLTRGVEPPKLHIVPHGCDVGLRRCVEMLVRGKVSGDGSNAVSMATDTDTLSWLMSR